MEIVEYEIQGLYGYGWECVTSEIEYLEARQRLKEYRENELGTKFRLERIKTVV